MVEERAEFEARFGFPLVEIWGMTEMVRAIVDSELVDGWTSCAISLWRKGEAPYALSITASSAEFPEARLAKDIVPRLAQIRDLLIPREMRVLPAPAAPKARKGPDKPLQGKAKR